MTELYEIGTGSKEWVVSTTPDLSGASSIVCTDGMIRPRPKVEVQHLPDRYTSLEPGTLCAPVEGRSFPLVVHAQPTPSGDKRILFLLICIHGYPLLVEHLGRLFKRNKGVLVALMFQLVPRDPPRHLVIATLLGRTRLPYDCRDQLWYVRIDIGRFVSVVGVDHCMAQSFDRSDGGQCPVTSRILLV
jgi:hypothetical protein